MMNRSFAALLFLVPVLSWSQTDYVVRKGDTLLKIADKTLGAKSSQRYEFVKKIQNLNPELKNANAIEPGQTLKIPSDTKAVVVEKAVQPAAAPAEILPAPTPTPPAAETPVPAPVAPTPVITQTPLSAHASNPSPHDKNVHEEASSHSNFFFIQPRYQMLEIKTKELATKTNVSMKSQSSFGLDVQYGWILNDHFHLLFQAGLTQTQFNDIKGDTPVSVNHKKETLKSFAAGVAYEATHTLHLDLMLMYADRTFLLPATLPDYELEAVAIPAAELNVSWDFYAGDSNIFGLSAIGEYLLSAKKNGVDYKSAFEPFGALYWKLNYGHDNMNYKATLTYKHGHQKTSVSDQKEDLTALGFGFYF